MIPATVANENELVQPLVTTPLTIGWGETGILCHQATDLTSCCRTRLYTICSAGAPSTGTPHLLSSLVKLHPAGGEAAHLKPDTDTQ